MRRTTLVLAVVATLVLPAAARAQSSGVTIKDIAYNPASLTVDGGTTVTWTHDDGTRNHSVTADDGSFDSSPPKGMRPVTSEKKLSSTTDPPSRRRAYMRRRPFERSTQRRQVRGSER